MTVEERLEHYRATRDYIQQVIQQLRRLNTAAPTATIHSFEERLQELEDAARGCLAQLHTPLRARPLQARTRRSAGRSRRKRRRS